MSVAVKMKINHPYITYINGICGGKPIIRGTRIPVWSIIKWYKVGLSIEEILREFPQLTPAQLHDTFSYYYDNQEDIEKEIYENENENYWKMYINDKVRKI